MLHIHIFGYLGVRVIPFGITVCVVHTGILDRSLSVGHLSDGFGGLFWVFIAIVIYYSSVLVSLAELESI